MMPSATTSGSVSYTHLDAPDAKPLTNVQGHISYEDVSFCYNSSEPVLSHVSFSIPAGRSIALVGPSGGGKTTICSLLPRFYDVTHGRISIDGQDIRKTTLKSLRSSIGLVQQEVYLFGLSLIHIYYSYYRKGPPL